MTLFNSLEARGIVWGGVLMAIGGLASAANAMSIDVPNFSFESPNVPPAPPFAGPVVDAWQKPPVPAYWLGIGQTEESWLNTTSGVFLNVDPLNGTPFDNAVGDPAFPPGDAGEADQLGLLVAVPEAELFQTLASTYEEGLAYRLTVGVEGGAENMLNGVPLELRLYYFPVGADTSDLNSRVTIASQEIVFNGFDPSGYDQSHLTDYMAETSITSAGSAWLGQPIGISIVSTVDLPSAGGAWAFDNVRLESFVPEPASVLLLLAGSAGLLARRRRA